MSRKHLVYTCVFGGYDRVYPPLVDDPSLDYVIVTDDPAVRVKGWRTEIVSMAEFPSPKAANLFYRALIHRLLPGYGLSLYVDGNVRLTGAIGTLFMPFLNSGASLGLCPHPLRPNVESEAAACLASGKVNFPTAVTRELTAYRAEGFMDNYGLYETTILLKNHDAPGLDGAMELWAELFLRYQTRDQLSLPFVLWRTGVAVAKISDLTWRNGNSYFSRYPHVGAPRVNRHYVHIVARSHDSLMHRGLLTLWEASWAVRRKLRKYWP